MHKSLRLLAEARPERNPSISAKALKYASSGQVTRNCDPETLRTYQNSKGRPKAHAMISLLQGSKSLGRSCMTVLQGVNQLMTCGHQRLRWFNNQHRLYSEDCEHGVCHKCEEYHRKQEAYKMTQKVLDCFHNECINRDHVSWVTIDICKLTLGSDFTEAREEFRTQLDKLLQRALKGSGIVGSFQIAMQENARGGAYDGMLHLHATFIHPEIPREELEQLLKTKFKLHNNAVDVAEHYEHQDIDEAVLISSYYAADMTTKGKTYGSDTGEVFARYLQSVELMRKGGRQGFRCNLGQRRLSNKIKDEIKIQKELKREADLQHIANVMNRIRKLRQRWNIILSKWSNNHLNIMVCPKLHGIQRELGWPRFEAPNRLPLIIWQDNHRHRWLDYLHPEPNFSLHTSRRRFAVPSDGPELFDDSVGQPHSIQIVASQHLSELATNLP